MLKQISNWFLKISSGRITLVCLLIFLLFGVLVLPDQAARAEVYSGDTGSPDTSLFYTSSDLYRFAEAYGPEGRAAYIRARFTFDVAFPLVYTAFLVTAISWLAKCINLPANWMKQMNLLPLAGMILDFLENGSAAIVIARYPQTTAVIDHLAGVFTLLKWVFIGGSFAALFIFALLFIWQMTQKLRKNSTNSG